MGQIWAKRTKLVLNIPIFSDESEEKLGLEEKFQISKIIVGFEFWKRIPQLQIKFTFLGFSLI